jgi:hypothetical protein
MNARHRFVRGIILSKIIGTFFKFPARQKPGGLLSWCLDFH